MIKYFSILSPILFILIVTILGFITPGYSHVNYTISRLAIEKYGWVQTLNFLQLAVGFILIAQQITKIMHHEDSKRIVRLFFSFAASVLVLTALVPTDPIDNVRFNISLFTPIGLMHVATITVFIFVFPYAFSQLILALGKEPNFASLVGYTKRIGAIGFIASIVWMIFFVLGIFLEYRGIFQKAIVLLGLTWIMVILRHSSTKHV